MMRDSRQTENAPRPACPILTLSPDDNVGVAIAPLQPGQRVERDGGALRIERAVELGHKVALRLIETGEKIYKHGAPIGSATRRIAPGEHVHTHNMKSDYLPTFTLDGANPYHSQEH